MKMIQFSRLCGLQVTAAALILACDAPPGEKSTLDGSLIAQTSIAHREDRFGVPTFVWLVPGAAPPVGVGAADVAQRALAELAPLYRLSPDALSATAPPVLHDTGRGAVIARYAQKVGDYPVFRLSLNIALDRTLRPVAASGYLAPRVRTYAANFTLDESAAVTAAMATQKPKPPTAIPIRAQISDPPIEKATRVRKVWYPQPDGLVPAYYVELDGAQGTDGTLRAVVVSAMDGSLLTQNSLTAADAATYRVWADKDNGFLPWDGPQGTGFTPNPTGLRDGTKLTFLPSQLVTLQNAPFSRNDPWLPAGATEARGNNAVAYADLMEPDGYSSGDVMLKTSAPHTFDYSLDPTTQDPAGSATAIAATTTSLFYIVNFMHDYFYDAGFDESSGNPQQDNYGRGGIAGDPILAEGQDYSGRDNANAAVPADGNSPRIQMYLWEHSRRVQVTAPTALATDYENGAAEFGPRVFDVTADTVRVDDGTAPASDGCESPFVNAAAVAGKIAIIDRGSCSFELKAANATAAGAVGVAIVTNDDSPPFSMSTDDPPLGTVTIPSVMLSKASGAAIETALAAGTTVTVHLQSIIGNNDSALDGTVLSHEWGHILSNRLIGDGSGLSNQQGGGLGEGWSDFVALLTYVRPEDAMAAANANWNGLFPVASYVAGPDNNAAFDGIRRYPYTNDMIKNPLSLRFIEEGVPLPAAPTPLFGADGFGNSEVHAVGEIWASMLFDCYVALLRDTTRYTFAQANRVMRDYLVAALKLTPINPTFLEARDALLAATYANDLTDFNLFAQAFARRGAGVGAISPDRESQELSGVTESTAVGADFSLVSIKVDDSVMPCDRDGVLDNNETGRLRVTLRNIGTLPLNATAMVSSTNPNITLPQSTLTFPTAAPFATTTATLNLQMQNATANEVFDIKLVVDAANKAVPGAVNFQQTFHGNYDVIPASSANDEMDDVNPV